MKSTPKAISRALRWTVCAALMVAPWFGGLEDASAQVREVINKLNQHPTVLGADDSKSYKTIFDAYLQLTPPPSKVGEGFNIYTIHSGMSDWEEVANWAEANTVLADALIKAVEDQTVFFGLPYGSDKVSQEYRDAGLFVEVAPNDTLREITFDYLDAINVIGAYATAEMYRQLEDGNAERAFDVAMAHIILQRQLADRDFLEEKLYNIEMMSAALTNLRDVFYTYRDSIPVDALVELAVTELPFLRPDRGRLLMPEADRIVSEALIREVFDEHSDQADSQKFRETFGAIQASETPLERFGAAVRWERIAQVHSSLSSSLERLTLVYDDWWRRWRIRAYDPILQIPTQFDRVNEIRYAAVIFSMENIQDLFTVRDRLVHEVNGTTMAAGLVAYHNTFGGWPSDRVKMYGQFVSRQRDVDPFDLERKAFKFAILNSRKRIELPGDIEVWVESGEPMMWSIGPDHIDDRGSLHSIGDAIINADMVIWPPAKAIAREQGKIE